jgi:hypothetical protein
MGPWMDQKRLENIKRDRCEKQGPVAYTYASLTKGSGSVALGKGTRWERVERTG